ncbi:MAG: Phosphate starvation-inducible protein PsiF precursor [Deltaproteobacteria bacterium ADurb.Bin135]|jgi:hypothetical protein|nr:MAG: Phosphate starvation-inducible protein PsiF precursor [Deltaproteobacteria bacterium ADurb.Bin135]
MKKFIVCMFLVFALVAVNVGIAAAVEAKKAPSAAQLAQQDKMKSCNKEATEKALKGDERQAFMKNCLSGKPAATKMTQQDKMKACNKDATAKALKGDERKKFMSECLKK